VEFFSGMLVELTKLGKLTFDPLNLDTDVYCLVETEELKLILVRNVVLTILVILLLLPRESIVRFVLV